MKNNLKGIGVALITPFDGSGEVDYCALRALVNHVSDGGVDYLVALGTTAETPTLTQEEKYKVLDCIKKSNTKNLPLVVGIGGNCTRAVIESFSRYDLSGVDAILSVTPYYNRPSQKGLYEHYKALAEASPIPILLYNVPPRTGVNMSAETTIELSKLNNICGIKEACGDIEQMKQIIGSTHSDFVVTSGDDGMAVELIAHGGDGVISVAANAFPNEYCAMVRTACEGDIQKGEKMNQELKDLTAALFVEGNPTGVKSALKVLGILGNNVRLPLVNGSTELEERFKTLIKTL